MSIKPTLSIKLPRQIQQIYIGPDITRTLISKDVFNRFQGVLLVVDINAKKNNSELYKFLVEKLNIPRTNIIELKPKPNYKEFKECDRMFKKMADLKLNRNSCLIAFGGGYVGDITGFAASIYMRGVSFIQIPTTLMSMGDCIMGKVAINYGSAKNLLGSFYSPCLVFVDTTLVNNLRYQEIVYGLVEIWKHSLLSKDQLVQRQIMDYLNYGKIKSWDSLVKFSLKTKKSYVERDFFDRNGAHKAVSLGHTFANYLERDYTMRHGVAVFYGIILSVLLGKRLKLISNSKAALFFQQAKVFERRIKMLKKIQAKINAGDLQASLKSDKITGRNGFTFVTLTQQSYRIVSGVSSKVIEKIIDDFKRLKLE